MALDFSNKTDPPYPRGMVNNNPGNIRPGDAWIGMIGTKDNFVVFKNMDYGLRALAIDLANKISKGYNTITKIITRYAPPSENNTDAYILSVESDTGYDKGQTLTADATTIASLMRAIINHEQGQPYAGMIGDTDIMNGIKLMPQSIMSRVTDFFKNNPASTGLIIVVIAVAVAILYASKIIPHGARQ